MQLFTLYILYHVTRIKTISVYLMMTDEMAWDKLRELKIYQLWMPSHSGLMGLGANSSKLGFSACRGQVKFGYFSAINMWPWIENTRTPGDFVIWTSQNTSLRTYIHFTSISIERFVDSGPSCSNQLTVYRWRGHVVVVSTFVFT